MESVFRSEIYEPHSEGIHELDPDALGSGAVLHTIKTGGILFQADDTRTLYRVERGAICHYVLWADGRHEVIEFAFPGDIIGLGHLSTHTSTAQAMVDTSLAIVGPDEFEEALEADDRLSFRLASALEREFEFVRDQAINERERGPTARVANFLLAMSNANGREGRGQVVVADDMKAGFVADMLDITIDKLSTALLSLKKEGAVKDTPAGLRIVDVPTLQRLADAA